MNQLTNLHFNNIDILNHQSFCVNITKPIIQPSLFNKPFQKYSIKTYNLLNEYLDNQKQNSQSQKVIRCKINK